MEKYRNRLLKPPSKNVQTKDQGPVTRLGHFHKHIFAFYLLYPIFAFVISTISVADPDPGSGAFLTSGSGMGKKKGSGSGMNKLDLISETLEKFFGLIYLHSLMRIQDGKNSDPG